MNFFGPNALNMDFFKKNFSAVWGDKYSDVFVPNSTADLNQMMMDKKTEMSQGQTAQKLQKAANPGLNQLVGKV